MTEGDTMEEKKVQETGHADELIFALDIGTHDIIGVVGKPEGQIFRVLQVLRMDYPRRAMRDGQIEDIEQVASVASKVRSELERRLGLSLRGVHVAAAGRALKTKTASYEITLEDLAIERQKVEELESLAIQQAEEELLSASQEENREELYYIGHSVIRYLLDDYPISTLIGHRGKRARAEIIATFLPGEVVESLYAVARRIGLSVSSITLEPIAAMNAIIPNELRMLNLALVDIGAGTSDIAISDGGSVAAYTMATVAGDEITEAIVKEYLVDFEVAEEMKFALSRNEEQIPYRDILGFENSVRPQEILEKLRPALDTLCGEICSRILEINGKPPAAVFLVGGGSRTVTLRSMVAKGLSLEENRVAVGGSNYIKKMVVSEFDVGAPDFATPMGIALTAAGGLGNSRCSVILNGAKVGLTPKGRISVMELLRLNGYERISLLGRSGKSVAYEIDGRTRVARGTRQTAAIITVNGQPASLTTELHPNDKVEVIPSVSGEDARITIGDAVEGCKSFEITVDGRTVKAGLLVLRNGEAASPDQMIEDKDVLQTRELLRINDLYREFSLDPELWRFWKNGEAAEPHELLEAGDEIRCRSASPKEPVKPTPPQVVASTPLLNPLRIRLNGMERVFPPKPDGLPYQFVDMLNFVEIDPGKPEGDILLRLNGTGASYLAELRDGDSVEIGWKK